MTGADAIILFVMALTLGLSLGGFAARLFLRPSKAVVAPQHDKIGAGVKFPAGTEMTCPDCGELIGTVVNDIYPCSPKRSSDFEFTYDKPYTLPPECPKCSSKPINGPKMHTKDGWIR